MRRRQPLDEIAAAELLFALGGEMDAVPARGERVDDRLVVAEVGEVPGDEEDLHRHHAVGRHGRDRPVSRSHRRSSAGVTPLRRAATSDA
ncbi:hypothetical protein D3C83_32910 [compost metagenome]